MVKMTLRGISDDETPELLQHNQAVRAALNSWKSTENADMTNIEESQHTLTHHIACERQAMPPPLRPTVRKL